ncbi:hypothetical protein H4S02_002676 [Coemansia sp. RSA 2611]|nr:hypothetical protein H4S02_002676 [Coemansia sp. RSA 2611]
MVSAVGEYKKAVRAAEFPAEGIHTYEMPMAAEERWRTYVQKQFGMELGPGGRTAQQAVPAPVSAATPEAS